MSGQTMLGMVIKFFIFTHLGACVFLKYGYQSFGLFECVVTKREREREPTTFTEYSKQPLCTERYTSSSLQQIAKS
jgi:hypothetical protein